MSRRFTSQELFELRNRIPIETLIEKKLLLPSKVREGFFRFLCPLCCQFQTAVNPKTNLGRCFLCERNFNTIDMVMLVNETNFVNSVQFLKQYLRTYKLAHPAYRPYQEDFVAIGDIIKIHRR